MKKVNHASVSVTLDKAEAAITVQKGDTLTVKMQMTAGTGFVWQVSGTPATCTQTATNYQRAPKGIMGGTTLQEISFVANATGKEDISFIYHRPFEKNPPSNTKILHLTVE